jgi:hypothetical protein
MASSHGFSLANEISDTEVLNGMRRAIQDIQLAITAVTVTNPKGILCPLSFFLPIFIIAVIDSLREIGLAVPDENSDVLLYLKSLLARFEFRFVGFLNLPLYISHPISSHYQFH